MENGLVLVAEQRDQVTPKMQRSSIQTVRNPVNARIDMFICFMCWARFHAIGNGIFASF